MKPGNLDPDPIVPFDDGRVRKHIVLTGVLQGIGCRPTVFRLATQLELAGWVINTASGVRIEIEGTPAQCDRFLKMLPAAIPSPGRIDTTSERAVPPLGETSFRINASLGGERTITPIPPDVAVCPECVEELFDPENHRFLYPFITCTLCGPRFTVVRSFPYDRERTSMADFTMCPSCRAEYETPLDRRFHSQTNSCPECGPSLQLTDATGKPLDGDPILETVRLFHEGKTVAVKGIGGFHLACDALNDDAVGRLRERKGRAEKPFAVMMPDVSTVRRFCAVSEAEQSLLASAVAPIVLLDATGTRVAANVAPDMGTLGVMLPYSPVHHLFFRHPLVPQEARPTALVMTSGNRSEEPIVRGNEEALARLGNLADAFLLHDREIVLRADDSIFRVIAGRNTVFRRSRGMVPAAFKLAHDPVPTDAAQAETLGSNIPESRGNSRELVIFGAGGDLKNSQAIIKGDQAVPGPHVGDLASPVAQEYFIQSAAVLADYLEAVPDIVAVDPHPEYFSSSLAEEMDAAVEEVYHHHAHAVSLLCEHGLTGPALFVVFDGTGYGTDGTIWGGEFLVADRATFQRAGHIGPFPLPGGEAAIREPMRILAGLLHLATGGNIPEQFIDLYGLPGDRVAMWLEAAAKGINSPLTSSAGRLFDAAAAAVGFHRTVTFEGQAAMWLEGIAERLEPQPNGDRRHGCHERPWVSQVPSYYAGRSEIAPSFQVPDATISKFRSQLPKRSSRHDLNFKDSSTDSAVEDSYPIRLTKNDPLIFEPAPLILEVFRDIVQGTAAKLVSARFHNSVAKAIAHAVEELALRTGLTTVGLTGGCFQNRLLAERSIALLEERGFRVLLHETVSPNDGGIALGQAVAARTRQRYPQAEGLGREEV